MTGWIGILACVGEGTEYPNAFRKERLSGIRQENGVSNVLQVPPLRGGDFQGMWGLSSDALYRAR